MDPDDMPASGHDRDEARDPHRYPSDELPSRERHPGPPPDDDYPVVTPAYAYTAHTMDEDGLYLRLGSTSYRLDHHSGLPQNMGDRDSVLAIALCELVIQRLLRANCSCDGEES